MVFKRIARGIFSLFHKMDAWSLKSDEKIYKTEEMGGNKVFDEIHSVWDYLNFRPNTQAFHLSTVLSFDEWIDMAETRRRIKDLFKAEYKNERSLYPYLKTLTDIGLVESTSIGGRMQWRKQDLLMNVSKKEGEKTVVAIEAKIGAKQEKKSKAE